MAKAVKRSARIGDDTLWDEIAALKRERILTAPAKLIAKRGYHGTTIDAIAEKFGATNPFVYYHLDSKADLLIEICQRGTVRALQAADYAISAKGSPRARLDQFVTDFTSIALENYDYVAVYFREEITLPQAHANRIKKMRKEIDNKLTKLL
jgi:AcrR family transcriptional regulator